VASSRAEFSERLNAARVERKLSIRALATEVDVPVATVQGWLNGKHFPVAALRPKYLQLVESLGLASQIPEDLWGDGWAVLQPALRQLRSPYLGLRPYRAADVALFCGRKAESERLATAVLDLRKTRHHGVVALVGPSGSGKSSLLAAGLIAGECMDGALAGWRAEILEASADLTAAGTGLDLIVVDQLEDVLLADPEHRATAMAGITALAQRTVVVVGLRSDAFAIACTEPILADALSRPVLLAPLARSELHEVITGPAALAGVTVDPALSRTLELDLAPGPSGSAIGPDVLPLLSTALLVTWAAGSGRHMMLADYRAAGGVSAAVESLAEDVFGSLSEAEQQAAEALFLRLVRLHGDSVVRQPLDLDAIDTDSVPVMDAFVAARMLTVAGDAVQISHDALIQHWARLAEWVSQSRRDLEALATLRQAAQIWVDSGRDAEALIPVQRLTFFSDWLTDEPRQRLLGPLEREYLAACQTRYESRLEAEQRTSGRLRARGRLAIGLAAATTALAVLAGTLFAQAQNSAGLAHAATLEAQSRQVAITARSLRAKDSNLVTQMATVSLALDDTQEARSAVLDATSVDAPLRWSGEPSAVLAVLPEARLVARGGGTGTVSLWRDGALESPGVDFTAGDTAVLALAAQRVGNRDLLAVGGAGFEALWDVTGEPRRLTELGNDELRAAAFSPDGTRLLLGYASGQLSVLDLANPAVPRLLETLTLDREKGESATVPPVMSLAVAADGVLFVGGPLGSIARWRLGAATAVRLPDLSNLYVPTGGTELAATRTQALAISPDGGRLAAGQGGRAALVWKLAGDQASDLAVVRGFNSWVNAVGFSANSARLITGCSDQDVTVFDAATGAVRRRMTTPAIVTGVALLGERPVAVGEDGTLRAWRALSPVLRGTQPIPSYNLATDATGDGWLAADNSYGSPNLWRVTNGSVVRMPDPQVSLPDGDTPRSAIAVARSGRYLVGASEQGRLVSWPLTVAGAGKAMVTETGLGTIATAKVSPDSSLVAAVEDLGTTVAVLRADEAGRLTTAGRIPAASASSVDFSSDSQVLAVARGDTGVELWSVADPANPSRLGTITAAKGEQKLAASRVSGQLAVGEASGVVSLWDITDPVKPVRTRQFSDPAGGVYSVDFSPDGRFIVASAGDDRIWTWDLAASGTQAAYVLDGDFGRPWDARFIDDGRRIAVTGGNGQIKLWTSAPATAKAELCAARGTPLTPDEWQRFLPGVEPSDPC
jgi:WD40 repeat protein/transcriptional regulator with XRE-family HTH domain